MIRSKFPGLVLILALLLPVAAIAQIVVVVNSDSGVEKLDRSEVVNIFLGSFRQLPSGIMATPIDLPRAHPDRAEFYRQLVGKNSAEINTYWARLVFSGKTRPPIQTEREQEAVFLVQSEVGGVTYLDRGKVSGKMRIVFELSK